jgi:hypothetical protein
MDGGMYHARDRKEIHKSFWQGSVKEGYHLEDVGVNLRIILKWTFNK